ncbi:MAG: hypothetical protein AAF828_03125 [Bacteroidota bacterium]
MSALVQEKMTVRYLLWIAASIMLCSCEVQNYIDPSQLVGSKWELTATSVANVGPDTYFRPAEVMTITEDSLLLENELIFLKMSLPLTEQNEENTQSFKFKLVADSSLIVESWINEALSEQWTFRPYAAPPPHAEILDAATSYTYSMFFDSMELTVFLEKSNLKSDTRRNAQQQYKVHIYDPEEIADVRGNSSKKGESIFLRRTTFSRIEMKQSWPSIIYRTWSLTRTDRKIVNFQLIDVSETGLTLRYLDADEQTIMLRTLDLPRQPNPMLQHTDRSALLTLLNEGQVKIASGIDFEENTKISYRDEEDFIVQGLEVSDIQQLDFTFSPDGTYAFFAKDRSVATGQYLLSKDLRFLTLGQDDRFYDPIPLFSYGPGEVHFRRSFPVRTPRPLGEVMTSYFDLELDIQLVQPDFEE